MSVAAEIVAAILRWWSVNVSCSFLTLQAHSDPMIPKLRISLRSTIIHMPAISAKTVCKRENQIQLLYRPNSGDPTCSIIRTTMRAEIMMFLVLREENIG